MNWEAWLGLALLFSFPLQGLLLVLAVRALFRWKRACLVAQSHERQAALVLVFLEGAYDKCPECVSDTREGHRPDCSLSDVLTQLGVEPGEARRKLRERVLGMTTKLPQSPQPASS